MGADQTPPYSMIGIASLLLEAAPPRPSTLISLLGEAEGYADFDSLIQEFLPEYRAEILGAGGPGDMVATFTRHFGERYFPLAHWFQVGDVDSLGSLTAGIIPQFQGVEMDDYDELSEERLGAVLSSLLVELEEELDMEPGIRLTLLDKAQGAVPQLLLEHVARTGYPLESLKALEGTPGEGALLHARVLLHATGLDFIDAVEEEAMGTLFGWDSNTVRGLVQEYALVRALWDRLTAFFDWLEAAPGARFARILRFLETGDRSLLVEGDRNEHGEYQLPLGLATGA